MTLHIRVTVDLPINVMVAWVAEYMAQKLELEDVQEALAAAPSQLHVNHLGARINVGRMLLSYPDRSMFLLSRGPLGENYHGHHGWVWQCQNCGSVNTKGSRQKKTMDILRSAFVKNLGFFHIEYDSLRLADKLPLDKCQ